MNKRSEAEVRSLAILFKVGTQCGLSDAELLERFLSSDVEAAESAFEGLVMRHGSMVFDICLRILVDAHDAQDAFQATFLILATRARSIVKQKSVGSWLHGVALRVARRARSDATRRKIQERRFAEMTSRDVAAEPICEQNDFQALHEEVERLPRKYREPIVLCYLEGMTLESAAGQLRCPIGTVGVRLMRARERLKARLTRRGLSSRQGALIAGLSSRGAAAIPPDTLVRSMVGAAVRLTAGGSVSLVAAKLTSEVLRSMIVIELAKMSAAVLAVVFAVGVVGGGFLVNSQVLASRSPVDERVQEGPPFQVGQKVVTKYQALLRVGDQVVDDDQVFRIYTVNRVDGERVRLVAEDVNGWVQANEIVLLSRAIEFYTEEIDRDPKNAWAYHNRGLIWTLGKEYEKAISDFTEAIRIHPESVPTFVVRGNTYMDRNEYDKAIADYNQVIRLDPKDIDVYYERGFAWWKKEEYDKAIADFGLAIQLDPQHSDAYAFRGWAGLYNEELKKALADFNKAIAIDAENPSAYGGRAWLWAISPDEEYRDGQKAVESAARACELSEWKEPSYLEILAAADAEAGDFDAAVKWQTRANELYTDTEDKTRGQARLELYREKKTYRDAMP